MFAPFGHLVTAMVTPFGTEGDIAWDLVDELVEHLVSSGTDTILVGGTTGESPNLSTEELMNLVSRVRSVIKGDTKLIVGSGTNSTYKSINLSRKAADNGADGLLLVNPYYNKPTQDGLEAHFKAIAEAVDIPVMLYNIPGRTAVNMLPSTVVKLAEVPNIVSIKEASGSAEQAATIRSLLPEDKFAVYSGDDGLTLPMLSVGACGVVSVASHIVGRKIHQMIDAYFSGDAHKATEIHLSLMPLINALFCSTNPIPVKYALNKSGIPVGRCRLPLTPLTDEQKTIVDEALKNLK